MNIVELARGCGFDADAMKQYAHRHNPWMMESENVVHEGHVRELVERFKGYQGSSFVQLPLQLAESDAKNGPSTGIAVGQFHA